MGANTQGQMQEPTHGDEAPPRKKLRMFSTQELFLHKFERTTKEEQQSTCVKEQEVCMRASLCVCVVMSVC